MGTIRFDCSMSKNPKPQNGFSARTFFKILRPCKPVFLPLMFIKNLAPGEKLGILFVSEHTEYIIEDTECYTIHPGSFMISVKVSRY